MTDIVVTQPKEAAQAERAAQAMLNMAKEYVVDSVDMHSAAGAELQAIARRAKEIESQRVYLKEPYLEGGRRIDAFFKAPLDFLKEADQLLRSRMLTFQQAEAAKAAEVRRIAEEAARKEREEQERIRREAEAEERRIRDEAAAADRLAREQADAARKAGDEAAARAVEEAAAAERAIALQAASEASAVAEAAADAIELAEIAPLQAPTIAPPKAVGVSTRDNWKAELTSLQDLVCAAADAFRDGDPTLLAYLQADMKALGQVAKALKRQARIPGVRIYNEASLAVRAA